VAHTKTGGERLRDSGVALLVGFVYSVASIPTFVEYLISSRGWTWLTDPYRWTNVATNALPRFAIVEQTILYALAAYVFFLLILCLRHRRPRLVIGALGTLTMSVAVLHLLAWLGLIAFYVIRFVLFILGHVARFVEFMTRHVLQFVVFLFDPASGPWAWASLACLAAIAVWITAQFGWKGVRFALLTAAGIALLLAFFVGLGALLTLIAPHLRFIGHIIQIVFTVAVVLIGVATVGQLLIDQFRSTAKAGSEKLGILMGAMGVGTTLATLLLESDAFHNYEIYPPAVRNWAETWMSSGSRGPVLDACVAAVVVALCVLFVIGNLVKMKAPPDIEEFQQSLVYIILGFLAAGLLSAIGNVHST
jgi:hypothetical protein